MTVSSNTPSEGTTLEGLFKGPLKGYIPPGERIIYRTRPSLLFIILVPLRALMVLAVLWALGAWAASLLAASSNDLLQRVASQGRWIAPVFAGLIAFRLFWQSLEWVARLYVLTDRRVIRVSGILSQRAIDVPLARVQNITVSRSIRERVLGLGTLGFATAGTAWTELAWVMIPKPQQALAIARDAITDQLSDDPPAKMTDPSPQRPIVLGIVGGIASGKSAVAEEFAALGCIVCDSDTHAKQALKQPEVRDQLVQWWGEEILDDQGDPDRAKIAAIVFDDPAQRKKLEALVHPLVHDRRAEQIKGASGAPAFIIDAPLLFEAGVDKECDAVIYVYAPRNERLRRAIEWRAWDEVEFDRREKAQIDLKTKRDRSDFQIPNTEDRAALTRRCKDLLARICATPQVDGAYQWGQTEKA